jgi:outer membrane protein OmpA-like peptidoglycan-associated protein
LIEQNEIHELYPFLPSIFFDAGSADFASRYQAFDDSSAIAGFSEVQIPGGTFQKHYQILNILGSRMRRNSTLAITLTGCNSRQPERGETRELSLQRAEHVRDYLVRMWSIKPERIRIEARDLPKHPADNRVERGREENRRVEIVSDDWEIMKVIDQHEIRQYPQPEGMRFQMRNGITDEDVASRRIEIRRNGAMWHIMGDSIIGLTKPESPEYSWGAWGNEDSIPVDESPYVAQLVVRSRSGVEYRSKEVEVPVEILTRDERYVECRIPWARIDRYSLSLFKSSSSSLDPINERILREIVCKDFPEQAKVSVTGYADELEGRDLRISLGRATAVESRIRRYATREHVVSIDTRGVGSSAPLYSTDLPEGRCFNRTVQVIIESPIKEWDGKWED